MVEPRLIYTAQSKQAFFCRDAVCEFVLRLGFVPLNPFRMFDYFLGDRVERDVVRAANDAVIMRADEVWVFGEVIADGVWREIRLARELGLPVRFFTVDTVAANITGVDVSELTFEAELRAAQAGNSAVLAELFGAGG